MARMVSGQERYDRADARWEDPRRRIWHLVLGVICWSVSALSVAFAILGSRPISFGLYAVQFAGFAVAFLGWAKPRDPTVRSPQPMIGFGIAVLAAVAQLVVRTAGIP
jgi:hypothetical protein